MKFKIVTIAKLFLFLIAACEPYQMDSSETKIPFKHSKNYEELMPIAVTLKDAIINKDIKTLKEYSNPDPLYGYEQSLDDANSEEYKYLFDDEWNKSLHPSRRSVYEILKAAKNLIIIFDEYKLKERKIIVAYYFDESKIKLKLPLTDTQANLWKKEFLTCRFVKTEEGWKVAYSIFDYGTDYLINVE